MSNQKSTLNIYDIEELIAKNKSNLESDTDTERILKTHLLLKNNNINSEVRQGWVIKDSRVQTKLYITFCIGAFHYFIITNKDGGITITKNIKSKVYRKRPSKKKLEKKY